MVVWNRGQRIGFDGLTDGLERIGIEKIHQGRHGAARWDRAEIHLVSNVPN